MIDRDFNYSIGWGFDKSLIREFDKSIIRDFDIYSFSFPCPNDSHNRLLAETDVIKDRTMSWACELA